MPPLVAYLIGGVSTIVGLLVSQGLLTNTWERTITGIASVVIPLGYLAVNAAAHLAHAKVTAAAMQNPDGARALGIIQDTGVAPHTARHGRHG